MAEVSSRLNAGKVLPLDEDNEGNAENTQRGQRSNIVEDWQRTIHLLADRYRVQPEEVTDWNIYMFHTRLKYVMNEKR